MLVLSRKKNESVVLNDNIVITVIEIRGDKVRLGFVHPREMPLHRMEVYEAIHGGPPPGLSMYGLSSSSWASPTAAPAPPPEAPATPPPPPAETRPVPPASMLDRVLDAIQARANVSVGREVLTQAIADAAVQALAADVVESTSPDQLKAMLLEALKAKK